MRPALASQDEVSKSIDDGRERLNPVSASPESYLSSGIPSGPRPAIYPGFLAAEDDLLDSPSTPSSSSSTLPYLQPSPPPPTRKAPPPNISTGLAPSQPSNSTLSPFPTASLSASPGRRSPFAKRPSPLDLKKGKSIGLDEEYEFQRDEESRSAGSDGRSTFSGDMQDLSLLRQSVKSNLLARPVESPLPTTSESGSSGFGSPSSFTSSLPADGDTIDLEGVLSLPPDTTLILDTRPYPSFLESHLERAANIAIPSLIFKRFRKSGAKWTGGWDALGAFIGAGKENWTSVDRTRSLEIVIVGTTAADEVASVLRRIMMDLVMARPVDNHGQPVSDAGQIRILSGGWEGIEQPETETALSTSLPLPKSGPMFKYPPPPVPESSDPPQRVPHHPSMPHLRQPALSISTANRRTPKLSLNLDPPRSATLGSFPSQTFKTGIKKKSSMLTIDVGDNRKSPSSPLPTFQAMCHQQSKLPPSPSSFGDIRRLESPNATARDDAETSGSKTARSGGSVPFIVSTILPSFLYLGPEITSPRDVEELQQLGVKRILNVALECDDDGGLGLKERFERYFRVPMRDIVEESGVAKGMRDSCDFLDDARLHSAPTYVHCRAGKSRSVTVVLAYLIHANAWSLKTAYAYVAQRRKGISPNIGFVAELMQFEEAELGLKQSGGVHGESGSNLNKNNEKEEESESRARNNPRYMRESLPPAWASLDARPTRLHLGHEETPEPPHEDKRQQAGEEKEIRKNGQWVHSRRIPVDRTTLQPGRRVSKAGLESLRPLPNSQSGANPDNSSHDHASTPGGEGRIGWV